MRPTTERPLKPLGIIAGNGQFPLLLASEARQQNRRVVAAAIREETDPSLEKRVARFQWFALGQIKKTIDYFRGEGVEEAVMAGQVKHTQLFKKLKLDFTAVKILATLRDKKTDTILGAIADEFGKAGIRLIPSTTYLKNHMAPRGQLSKKKPSGDQQKDIEFGFKTAKAIAGLDLGQTVCVKNQAVLAVETMEGTDNCIARAGTLCDGRFVVVKVSKPRQDIRFDVPVIGPRTLEALQKSHAAVLAVEADKTLFFDKAEFIKTQFCRRS